MSEFNDPVLVLLPSAFFALLWGVAATHKFLDWSIFEQQVAEYRVLPAWSTMIGATLLPILEATLAIALISDRTRTIAAGGTVILLLLYAFAISINLVRGRDSIDCGCGSADGGQVIRWGLVWRNLFLALLGFSLMIGSGNFVRPMNWVDYVSVIVGALVLMGLYLIGNQILANFPPQRALR